jgi:zeta-carotene desaturase
LAVARVAVLGGGLAGLAAALRLAEAGYAVQLIERRPALGGRASSFVAPGERDPIDNCQHVLLGCCTNLLDFFRRSGVAHHLRFYNSIAFAGPRGTSHLRAAPLPAPFHLLPSLLSFRGLNWRDRLAVARALWLILRSPHPVPDAPLLDWLQRHGQSLSACENFWRVVLTSALNEDLERISTRPAFHVFLDAFIRNRHGYRVGIPTVPLSALYSSQLLRERCVQRLSAPVTRLRVSSCRVTALHLQGGGEDSADFYISALPPKSLCGILPDDVRSRWPQTQAWNSLDWSPITGIHLWFDRPVMRPDHLAVYGRTIQWVFNKTAIAGDSEGALQYIQLVISASRALSTLPRDEILARCLPELAELLPETRLANLQKAVVVRQPESTPSFTPGSDALRPGPDTPFANLFLAGDWTATGWPPTMESAVRSGYRAAERLTEAAGEPRRFLVPDLPVAPLARLFRRR